MHIKQRLRHVVANVIAMAVPGSILMDRRFFMLWETRGYHILPASFYSPVPVLTQLNGHLRAKRDSCPSIDMRHSEQRRLLAELELCAAAEGDELNQHLARRKLHSGAFGGADVITLYTILRHLRPRRVIEVGAGASTIITGYALQRNAHDDSRAAEFTSVDPYHNQILTDSVPGLTRRIAQPVQNVDRDEFESLEAGDVLFIDSSHVCKVGSDVNHLVLDILPRLKMGVWVHFHDIFLPNEYPTEWIEQTHRFWNEQYVLQAFLAFNSAFQVELATNYLFRESAAEFRHVFDPEFALREPGSFWISKVA